MKVGINSEKELPKINKEELQEKYVVWHVEGGLGKNIAATSLLSDLKKKHMDRKLIMVVSFPEIFLNFPEVWRVLSVGNTPYFYEDYIEDKDTIVYRHEGYFQSGHINKQKHLIESWCELMGLEYTNQRPILLPNMIQKNIMNVWFREKPVLVIQTNGGYIHDGNEYSWTRDIHPEIAQELINYFSKKYHVIQICKNARQGLQNCEVIHSEMSNFELFSVLAVSQKRILIDSCLQHAAVAMKLPSTVLWIGTNPKVFGYKMHNNIIAKPPIGKPKLIGSYIFDYSFDGRAIECPYYDSTEIFNTKDLIKKIENN